MHSAVGLKRPTNDTGCSKGAAGAVGSRPIAARHSRWKNLDLDSSEREDSADVALLLASDVSRMIVGQTVLPDGGVMVTRQTSVCLIAPSQNGEGIKEGL